MKWWKKCFLLLGLFIVCATAGLYAASRSPEISGQVAPAQAADMSYITLTGQLEQRSQYLLCGHVMTQTKEMPAKYVGLNRQELRELLPDTSITEFSRDKVVLTKRYDCYCPQHLVVYLQDDRLQVLQTTAYTGEAEQIGTLPIAKNALSAAELRALKNGKVFADMQEVEAYAAAYSAE